MKKLKKRIINYALLAFLIVAIAIEVSQAYPIYVKPKVDGALQPLTVWNYTFNFSNDSACTDVVLSNTSIITTGVDGIGFVDVNISLLENVPNYLCEYRNGSLRLNKAFPDMILHELFATNITLVGGVVSNSTATVQGNIFDIPAPDGGTGIRTDNNGNTLTEALGVEDTLNVSGVTDFFNDVDLNGNFLYLEDNGAPNQSYLEGAGARSTWYHGFDALTSTVLSLDYNDGIIVSFAANTDKAVYPFFDNFYDLGKVANRWQNVFVSKNLSDGTHNVSVQELESAYNSSLNITDLLRILLDDTSLLYNFYDDGSELWINSTAAESIGFETENAKMQLFNEPTAGNNWKVFELFHKAGGTESGMVIHQAGPNNATFFKRSLRVGGAGGSNCGIIDTKNLVDCNTSTEGSDIVVQNIVLGLGGGIFGNDTTINLTDTGVIQMKSVSAPANQDTESFAIINNKDCYWDNTRKDWLSSTEYSHDFGNQVTGAGSLRPAGRPDYSSTVGHYKSKPYTITGYEVSSANTPTSAFRIFKNSSLIEFVTWNQKHVNNYTTNISVEANYILNMDTNAGVNPNYPVGTVYYRWQC